MRRILIFAEKADWHARQLATAMHKQGAAAQIGSLRDCAFALDGAGPGIVIPRLAALPDAVLVKTIAAGSFEQVTLRLSLLHALARLGVPVVNDARTIERCVDKAMTSFLLHRAGIPIPATLATENSNLAAAHLANAATDLVQKPLFGSQGRGLARLPARSALPSAEAYAGVHYLQRFVGRDRDWADFRVMVIGGRPIAAMMRHGRDWITNVGRGARCEGIAASGRLAELSVAAADAVGAGYAGIDVIADADGELRVLEVNSMPAWHGLQSVTAENIAEALARHVLERLA